MIELEISEIIKTKTEFEISEIKLKIVKIKFDKNKDIQNQTKVSTNKIQ